MDMKDPKICTKYRLVRTFQGWFSYWMGQYPITKWTKYFCPKFFAKEIIKTLYGKNLIIVYNIFCPYWHLNSKHLSILYRIQVYYVLNGRFGIAVYHLYMKIDLLFYEVSSNLVNDSLIFFWFRTNVAFFLFIWNQQI